MGKEKRQRGPGGLCYRHPPGEHAKKYYLQGLDAERVAYGMNLPVSKVIKLLDGVIIKKREQEAHQEILEEAHLLVVEERQNFFDARDQLRIHADTLVSVLCGLQDCRGNSIDGTALRHADAHAYAMIVYKSSKFSIWEVACALECTEKQAKQVLGRAYDPYIEHKLDRERGDKARRLYAEGLSLGQIKFRVKADEWEIKTWVGEGLISESKARLRREAREARGWGIRSEHLR